jgi:murein DD-endopeptidase MepM/ murein hydrolase activator NlpD
MNYSRKGTILLFLLVTFVFGFGHEVSAAENINQKILDLRKQIEELTKQSELYKKNITEKQKEADTLNRQIGILNNQIAKLLTQIQITNQQISSTKLEITILENDIFTTQKEIIQKKNTIGNLLFAKYERDKNNLLAVVLRNQRLSDFNDEIQQEEYLNQKLILLLAELSDQKEKLEIEKADLEAKKVDLETLSNKQKIQKDSATESKNSKDKLLTITKGKEKEYQKLLQEVEKKETEFFQELQKLEAEAVKSGAFILRLKAASIPPRKNGTYQWPLDDYYITQSYGMTTYAKRGAYGGAPHNGVDIAGDGGATIKPIAEGEILASGFNDGFGNWVAVRHNGDVVSIYAHMRSPTGLANGTDVKTDSIIGYQGSTGNSTGPHVHLSIYYDFFTYINPKNNQIYFNYFEGTLNPLNYL